MALTGWSSKLHSMAQAVRLPQAQGDEGLIATAVAGGSIHVEVGPNDASITVTNATTGDVSRIKVSPGKDTDVPIPNVPPGTVFSIRIGVGPNARIITVEVIAPGP